jgi:hypothetical protein
MQIVVATAEEYLKIKDINNSKILIMCGGMSLQAFY